MNKNELLTFIILSTNFIVTGLVIERPGIINNVWIFVPLALLAAFALTKYIFRVSRIMRKDEKK